MDYNQLKLRLKDAFKELRSLGYIARMDFWCCQSCGCSAISDMKKYDKNNSKYVFYHNQDKQGYKEMYERYIDRQDLRARMERRGQDVSNVKIERPGMFLAWEGDAKEICDVLSKHGLTVDHDGTEEKRIWIEMAEAAVVA